MYYCCALFSEFPSEFCDVKTISNQTTSGLIRSHNYPNHYSNNLKCDMVIRAPDHIGPYAQMILDVHIFDTEQIYDTMTVQDAKGIHMYSGKYSKVDLMRTCKMQRLSFKRWFLKAVTNVTRLLYFSLEHYHTRIKYILHTG